MTLEIKRSMGEATIKVVGRLDRFTAPVLEKTIDQLASGVPGIVLDMSGLEQISDTGVKVLLGAHEKLKESGALRLTGVGESIMETLRANGGADVLAIS